MFQTWWLAYLPVCFEIFDFFKFGFALLLFPHDTHVLQLKSILATDQLVNCLCNESMI